ncbi:uncharacterized protein isoform X1 [Danio rerio]|uniref:Uncharacterized protein isoform X1 n=1 Tax=Danio rerio TaxID=7955 RepID=A0AC58JVY9_DANRE
MQSGDCVRVCVCACVLVCLKDVHPLQLLLLLCRKIAGRIQPKLCFLEQLGIGIMGVTHGKKADHNLQSHNSACAQPLIGPGESDLVSDLGSLIDPDQRWAREEDLDHSKLLPEHTDYEELIRPKKLHNPIKASKSHRELQRELIITHKRGVVVEEKPELQRVLEQRNRAQALKQEQKQEEEKSPLEQELLKRQMSLRKRLKSRGRG